jgi:hypothetical protein
MYRKAGQERKEKPLNLCELRALRGSKTNHTKQGHHPGFEAHIFPEFITQVGGKHHKN